MGSICPECSGTGRRQICHRGPGQERESDFVRCEKCKGTGKPTFKIEKLDVKKAERIMNDPKNIKARIECEAEEAKEKAMTLPPIPPGSKFFDSITLAPETGFSFHAEQPQRDVWISISKCSPHQRFIIAAVAIEEWEHVVEGSRHHGGVMESADEAQKKWRAWAKETPVKSGGAILEGDVKGHCITVDGTRQGTGYWIECGSCHVILSRHATHPHRVIDKHINGGRRQRQHRRRKD